jgi:hypothetical protein
VSSLARSSSLGRCASSEDCDRCGRNWLRCRNTFLTSLRLAIFANDSSSGYRRPCWLGHPARLSDGRHATSHPFLSRSGVIATRVRLGVIGCVGGCGLNQSTGQQRHHRRTRHDRPDHHDGRARLCGSVAYGMTIRSGASHEVLSPSALAGRVALRGAAGLRTIPLRRFMRPPALLRTLGSHARPCGLSHCGACRGDARVMDEPG